jgi:DNA-binding NarL/FixJ family response regulator
MSKLRILLADDHEIVREGLRTILNAQSDMEVVAEAVDGIAAVERTAAVSPDIVVMDISMPKLSGLSATEAIRKRCPQVKVLTLTRHSDRAYVEELLRAGAAGYVLKQSRSAELLRAIRALASGNRYLDSQLIETGVRSTLSKREEEVLRLVAQGYSNKEIAAQLTLSVKTVETHKANAAQKLGLRSRIDVVRFGMLRGWLRDA